DRPCFFTLCGQAVQGRIHGAANRQPFLSAILRSQDRSVSAHSDPTPFIAEGYAIKRIALRARVLPPPPPGLRFARERRQQGDYRHSNQYRQDASQLHNTPVTI